MIRVGVAIMAHRKREAFVPELLAKLDRSAEVVWDAHDDRWDTGRRAMLAYATDPAATHWMVIQDDAIVCRDLAAGVEAALAHVPAGSPLCLYAGRVQPFGTAIERAVRRAGATASWLAMQELHWGVGIVMPAKRIPEMVEFGDTQTQIANYDARVSRWGERQGLTVYYPWPSLVDHRNSPSLVAGRTSQGRRAHRFLGADASALDVRWDGAVVRVPALSAAAPARRAPVRVRRARR